MVKFCHDDPSKLFKIGKAQLWAGSRDAVLEKSGWALMISALGMPTLTCPFVANEGAKSLLPPELLAWTPSPILGIDWPDRGIPRAGAGWWKLLHKAIGEIEGDVVVYCMGGHGRTGTMLSILASLTPGVVGKKKCPVEWVRKVYCKEAVETSSQVDYIERVTGRKVGALGSDMYTKSQPAVMGYPNYSTGGQPSTGGSPFGSPAREAELAKEEEARRLGGESSLSKDTSTTIEVVGVPEVLYRWSDEAGTYWTDDQGVVVAVEPDEDDFIDEEEEGVELAPDELEARFRSTVGEGEKRE